MKQLRGWLSRYRWTYLEALVYMLQANEYDTRLYLEWLHRTINFTHVMRRKKLVYTTKAKLLLAWLGVLYVALAAVFVAIVLAMTPGAAMTVMALTILIAGPFILAYGLLLPLLIGTWLIQKPRERQILAETKQILARHPATKIAIAGSFGKTTFKEILASTLGEAKVVAATPGNMNTPLGISRFAKKLTGNEEILIFELGEYYPGDIKKLCELVQPDMGVITGINEAHLMRFKTLDRTVATIYELADYLGDKPLWVNGESELAAQAARTGNRVYDRKGVGSLKVQHAKSDLSGTSFRIVGGGTKLRIESGLLGLHNVGPLVAVADVASHLGLEPKSIESGLTNTQPFEHRMQPMTAGGITTIDDSYNGNPAGAKAAIDFLRGLNGHRRVYVTPGLVEMGDRAAEVHREIGRQLADAVEVVVLVRDSVTPFIEEGLQSKNFTGQIIWYDDGLSCLNALPHITKPGDVVLLQNDWADNYA